MAVAAFEIHDRAGGPPANGFQMDGVIEFDRAGITRSDSSHRAQCGEFRMAIFEADNVILALNLLTDRPAGKVAFDEYHHGYGASSTGGGLLSYFRGTPVPWMLAQAGLIAALVVYSYGRRFGRPIPLRQERRTTNLEFVSSMANITRLAHASDLAMENIYSEFRKRLCRFSGVPAKIENGKLAAAAARRARLDERTLAGLLSRCEAIAQGVKVSY